MKTDIGIENEKSGFIPDTDWKMRRFGDPWQQGESIISGIGQGYILTTPIQLATMISRIANGGYEVSPTFKKFDKNKETVIQYPTGSKQTTYSISISLKMQIARCLKKH